ncbi:HhoA/HhoB/HtrA family serine endopeptidase [Chroococcus sp. FPU101]|uniref:HhoA/HhoB/HtrA family serine endopeptidase n=1 Tax=Chroococcus sp. FPU101 TaxID=1974212 RepID=UPI001A8FE76C|nr:HhoA/HhoB/HtrA family serine endopeptidase [Chroococcus sp. FPU101]GFE70286.1 2-alkenal reductase [Chroococcus sp. FPU101]
MKSSQFFRQLKISLTVFLCGVLLCLSSVNLDAQADTLSATGLCLQEADSASLNTSSCTPDAALGGILMAQQPKIEAQSFVAAAVIRTGPSVVRIDTETVVTRRNNPLFEDPLFRDFFGDQFNSRIPLEQRVSGQGSGFIVDESGIILTNAHVVKLADKVTVTLKDGRSFEGAVQGTDEVTDLAVVKINTLGAKLPVAPLGDSSEIQVGDWAIAVGNPVGLDNTVTLGIISTIGRSAAKAGIPDKRLDFIQTDAAINPGNSGGPLLNAAGEVIGINTAIRADALGIGFAIPINKAKELEPILATGELVPHPYIGVQMVSLTPGIARDNNQDINSPFVLPEVEGLLVVKVLPNTPAERSGIRRTDIITEANGKRVTEGEQLQEIVEAIGINKPIQLTVQRGEKVINLTVITDQLGSNT